MENKHRTFKIVFKRNNKRDISDFIVDSADTFDEAYDLLMSYITLARHMGLRVVNELGPQHIIYTNDHEELGEYFIKED